MQVQAGKFRQMARIGAGMALWSLLVPAPLQAAEFGDAAVSSFIGQPLVAEVELTALTLDEQGALQVKPAPLDVYRGANIQFNPVLATLHWVVQHRGQRQFIRITTDRPIRAPYLNLFFELGVKNNTSVRALTLWLDEAPNGSANAEAGLESGADAVADARQTAVQDDAAAASVPAGAQSATAAAHPLCKGEARCAAAERENRIISRHISELEKNVGDLRKVITGGTALPRAVKVPVPKAVLPATEASATALTESSAGASADTPLFLDKEAPILPKRPEVKTTPWSWYAMVAASLLALGLLALLVVKKIRRAQKPMMSKPGPVRKPSAFAAWRTKWLDRWRQGKGRKPSGSQAVKPDDAVLADADDGTPGGGDANPPAADGAKAAPSPALLASLLQRWNGIKAGVAQSIGKLRKKPAPASGSATVGKS